MTEIRPKKNTLVLPITLILYSVAIVIASNRPAQEITRLLPSPQNTGRIRSLLNHPCRKSRMPRG